MTSRDFAYWLQGFFEISQAKKVTPDQLAVIKNHLNMVFKHEIDPSHGDAAHQKKLSDAHEGVLSKVQEHLKHMEKGHVFSPTETRINC